MKCIGRVWFVIWLLVKFGCWWIGGLSWLVVGVMGRRFRLRFCCVCVVVVI